MIRLRKTAGATAALIILSLLPISGPVLAHGGGAEDVDFTQHMDQYATDIKDLIASVDDIVADYQPDGDYAEALEGLTDQWETVDFHLAVERNATPLYPPIWAAIGAFSKAVKNDAAAVDVQTRADGISAALWQGYGALKLLAAGGGHGGDTGDQPAHSASAEDVIDTINDKLDLVLVEYKEGETEEALEIIHDTYMNYFEGIEGDLIEQDADLVSNLEIEFNATLPGLIKDGAPADKVADKIDSMQDILEQAEDLLEDAAEQQSSVF